MAGAAQHRNGLRLRLSSGVCAVPLDRVARLVGYAALAGEPDGYFLGWLTLQGDLIPVFDLNKIVCEEPTPENFGSRILVVDAAKGAAVSSYGLLAAGVTDTVPMTDESLQPLDLDSYLQMLDVLTPTPPQESAA